MQTSVEKVRKYLTKINYPHDDMSDDELTMLIDKTLFGSSVEIHIAWDDFIANLKQLWSNTLAHFSRFRKR